MRTIRLFPLLISLTLFSACNGGGKDNASDSSSSSATKLASYSTADLLGILGASDLGKELLTLAYTPKCSIDVYQLSYETVGGEMSRRKRPVR